MLHGREVGQAQGAARPQLCTDMSQPYCCLHPQRPAGGPASSSLAQKHPIVHLVCRMSAAAIMLWMPLHQAPVLRGDGAVVGSHDCSPPAALFMLSSGSQAPSPLAAASAASSAAQLHVLRWVSHVLGLLPSGEP